MNTMQTIRTMKMIRHQKLILQRMLGADRHNGLGRLQRLKTLGPPGLFPPGSLLFQHMEQCDHVPQTAGVKGVSVATQQ